MSCLFVPLVFSVCVCFGQALTLCPKDQAKLHPTIVGVDACTYGPAFWCASMDNARKCGVRKGNCSIIQHFYRKPTKKKHDKNKNRTLQIAIPAYLC